MGRHKPRSNNRAPRNSRMCRLESRTPPRLLPIYVVYASRRSLRRTRYCNNRVCTVRSGSYLLSYIWPATVPCISLHYCTLTCQSIPQLLNHSIFHSKYSNRHIAAAPRTGYSVTRRAVATAACSSASGSASLLSYHDLDLEIPRFNKPVIRRFPVRSLQVGGERKVKVAHQHGY